MPIRNTTSAMAAAPPWTGNFAQATFHNGQGVMVRAENGINALEDLEGGSVSVAVGTTAEFNPANMMTTRGINHTPVVATTNDNIIAAYAEDHGDAASPDKSGPVGRPHHP